MMLYQAFRVLFTLCFIQTFVYSQRISDGFCPHVNVKPFFNITEYTGRWYEIERNPAYFEFGQKCNYAEFEKKNSSISVSYNGININKGTKISMKGNVTIPDETVPAKMKILFEGGCTMPKAGDYWVLGTDYQNCSVVYSCFDIINMYKAEFLWILSRKPTLDEKTKDIAYDLLNRNSIDREGLTAVKQDCYSFYI